MHYDMLSFDIIDINYVYFVYTGQEMATKRDKLRCLLTQIAPILQNWEYPIQNQYLRSLIEEVHDLFVRLQRSIKVFESPEELNHSKTLEKSYHEAGKAEYRDKPIANGSYNPISAIIGSDGQQHSDEPSHWSSSESSSTERQEYFRSRGMSARIPPADSTVEVVEIRDIYTTRLEDLRDVNPSLPLKLQENDCPTHPEPAQIDMEWSSSILRSNVFEADPFWLLIVFLSVSTLPFQIFSCESCSSPSLRTSLAI